MKQQRTLLKLCSLYEYLYATSSMTNAVAKKTNEGGKKNPQSYDDNILNLMAAAATGEGGGQR